MPLIDLKTDLRSLRFGNDRPGGGSSGQPYIQKPLPSPEDSPSNIFNTGGPDFLLRGGLMAPSRVVNDVSRLTQMFFDLKSPKGLLFSANQNLLSRTAVKTEASKGIGYGGGGVNAGVYLPTSTILQAGVGGTGAHLNLLGLDPTSPVAPDDGGGFLASLGLGLNSYFNVVKNQEEGDNRLVGLYDAISLGESKERFGGQKGVNLNTNGNTVLLEYGGGPGSILGIGKTKIPFADQRTGKNNPLATSKPGYFLGTEKGAKFLTVVSSPEDFMLPSKYNSKINFDFRKTIAAQNSITDTSTILSTAPGYTSNKALDQRVNQGSPGAANTANNTKNVYNYGIAANQMQALDKITALPMYESPVPASSKEKPVNDLVKFRIATINNNKSDGSAVYMHFRAFINDFTDNYGANWNTVQYVGRGDSLANYGGFTRDISIGFTVFAQSKAELIPMYKKLNYLASTLAPDYTDAGFMRGNLVRITMGGYIFEQPGYLTNLNYTIPQESPWEIGINEKGEYDESVKELPHMIRVSLAFTPIHDFLPQKGNVANNPDQRYIALANAFDSRGNYADEYKFDIPSTDSGEINNVDGDITDPSLTPTDNTINLSSNGNSAFA